MTEIREIERFADLQVGVEAQVDRRQMTLRELLTLEENSIIKLSRSAGENMDVLVGGSLIGHGEIVIIGDAVGIRITDFREE